MLCPLCVRGRLFVVAVVDPRWFDTAAKSSDTGLPRSTESFEDSSEMRSFRFRRPKDCIRPRAPVASLLRIGNPRGVLQTSEENPLCKNEKMTFL